MLATENRSKVELLGVVIPLPIIETEVLVDDVTVAVGISGSENQKEKMKERENWNCVKKEIKYFKQYSSRYLNITWHIERKNIKD